MAELLCQDIAAKYSPDLSSLKNMLPDDMVVIPDDVLVAALQARKGDAKLVLELLDNYLNGYREHPTFFPIEQISMERSLFKPEVFDLGISCYVSGMRTVSGNHVIMTDWGKWSPNKFDAASIYHTIGCLAGALSSRKDINEDGFILMSDMSNLGMKQVSSMIGSPKTLLGSIIIPTNVAPMNCPSVVVFNSNWYFEMVWKVAKPMLTKKVGEACYIIQKNDRRLEEFLCPEVIANKSYEPTQEDLVLSKKMAQEWHDYAIHLNKQIMRR